MDLISVFLLKKTDNRPISARKRRLKIEACDIEEMMLYSSQSVIDTKYIIWRLKDDAAEKHTSKTITLVSELSVSQEERTALGQDAANTENQNFSLICLSRTT